MDKVHRLLGLARRAGKVIVGIGGAESAVRSGNCELLVLATDASTNTKKRMNDKCTHYQVQLIEHGTKESLGTAVGYGEGAVIAVTDGNFKKAVLEGYTEIYGGGVID